MRYVKFIVCYGLVVKWWVLLELADSGSNWNVDFFKLI